MTEIREILNTMDPELLLADRFDDCIIGVASRYGEEDIVAYDYQKAITKLQVRDGMSREDAEEFYEFNIADSYSGFRTPCFIQTVTLDEN